MKRLYFPLSLVIALSWAFTQPEEVLHLDASFLALRSAFMVLTGALALGWMTYSMLLALRPLWLERALGGLDQLYREHRWAGIGAVSWIAAHWLIGLSPRALVAWGWITLPARMHGHRVPPDPFIGLAHGLAEPTAWLMIGLACIALLRWIPYG
jgi:predicted ferric reductase